MLLLGLVPHHLDMGMDAILDVGLLVVLTTPVIYFWVIKPFVDDRDKALEQIRQLALTDPLTQLPNRRLISEHLGKAVAGGIRHDYHGAVLLIDLDGFKLVNDSHGHDAGDAVLVETARRLQSVTRSADVAGRLGGDEFVIVINQLDSDERAARDKALIVAEKVIDLINDPFEFNGKILKFGATIGIRLFGYPEQDAETVITEADKAMYQAKRAGRGCAVIFET